MSHEIKIESSLTKEERYRQLMPQVKALIADESDLIANMANICGAMKYAMEGIFWVGFYFVKGGELVLGPYQGPVACTRIQIPNGVCGAAAERMEAVIVEDVEKFPGHIACSSLSKSEIVIPIIRNGKVLAVLDVDSDRLNMFDKTDEKYLSEICAMIKFV